MTSSTTSNTTASGTAGGFELADPPAATDRRPNENPYLAGNYAPVAEEVTAFDLPVLEGQIPDVLDGRYLRNGPNPVAADPARYHWFTGTGMVHGIRLRDGRAEWYRNRFVRGGSILDEKGWPDPGGPTGVMAGAVNTNVIGHADRTLALVEAGSLPIELTDELDTVARTDLAGPAGGLRGPFTAHPKRDPGTGELHAAAYYWGFEGLQYVVVGADGGLTHQATISLPGQPMVHDISITESRVVLYDLPCTFDLDVAMSGTGLPYRWNPDHGARVGVLPKGGSDADVAWFEVENCYVYHPLNAYDLPDGRIVVDVVRHPSMFETDVRGPSEGSTTLDRWVIDPAAGRVTETRLDDRGQELPRVDERVVGPGAPVRLRGDLHVARVRCRARSAAPPRPPQRHRRDPRLRPRPREPRSRVRATERHCRRGRRLGDVGRVRRRQRQLGAGAPRRRRLQRSTGVPHPATTAGPLRVPRQLGADRLLKPG